ncbi:creatininase family protein [Blastococcus brunescens]|uniref:Creatininase family protein n=1 Tax=Blastococcus brunescens TaxID=1564165 RepID=A0ABZ1B1A1_9ACTN|nr:creatininase family protein [Blastococcus sp. BMG 8361]WRL63526.1 creatininase family protein [Blastococcus sp. BMG 8361]
MSSLAGAVWPEIPGAPLLVVPLGSVEQHGHHLPLGTDTAVACAVVDAAAGALDGALVAPALAYGASGEHEGFPGRSRSAPRRSPACWSSTAARPAAGRVACSS